MVKVSIILPIYNVAKYLPRCLDSVLNQTLRDIEIILATDGPADCDAICNEYAQKDGRIKIISHPGSYGKAVNQGIKSALGEYIGIVETDDWCDLTMFEKLYQIAKQYDADVAKASFYCVKDEKTEKKVFSEEIKLLTLDKDKDFFDFTSSLWSAIYKTSFLKKNNIVFIEEKLSFIDTPFVLETFIKSDCFIYLPEALYFYNCNNPESSVKNSERFVDSIKAEEFFYNKISPQIFKHIKREYLIGLASRLRWNLNRIKIKENKQLFWEEAHRYIQKIGLSKADLVSLPNENMKQLLISLNQTAKYDDIHIQKEFKLWGISLLNVKIVEWKKMVLYLLNVFPLCSVRSKKGKSVYKLFDFLPIFKTERKVK